MKSLANVKGLGEVVEVAGDFYNELQALRQGRAKLISPRNEAYARIETAGKEAIGKTYGTRTTAGLEYAKGQLPLFRLNSRLMNQELAKMAVEANSAGRYFSTESTREYKESLKQAEKDKSKAPAERNVIVLPSRDNFSVTSQKNFEVLEFALK